MYKVGELNKENSDMVYQERKVEECGNAERKQTGDVDEEWVYNKSQAMRETHV